MTIVESATGSNRPGVPTLATGRWAGWARSLSARYRRVSGIPARATLLFASPQPIALQPGRRWLQVRWTLAPRINLALHAAVAIPGSPLSLAQPPGRAGAVAAWGRASSSVATGHESPSPMLRQAGAAHLLAGTPLPSPTALRRVFARVGPTDDGEVGPSGLRPGVSQMELIQDARRTLRRLLDEHKRIEVTDRSVLVNRQTQTVVSETGARAQRVETYESAWGPRAAASGMAVGAAPVDIERLTDQVVRAIDHRMVAYRERMGKLF